MPPCAFNFLSLFFHFSIGKKNTEIIRPNSNARSIFCFPSIFHFLSLSITLSTRYLFSMYSWRPFFFSLMSLYLFLSVEWIVFGATSVDLVVKPACLSLNQTNEQEIKKGKNEMLNICAEVLVSVRVCVCSFVQPQITWIYCQTFNKLANIRMKIYHQFFSCFFFCSFCFLFVWTRVTDLIKMKRKVTTNMHESDNESITCIWMNKICMSLKTGEKNVLQTIRHMCSFASYAFHISLIFCVLSVFALKIISTNI